MGPGYGEDSCGQSVCRVDVDARDLVRTCCEEVLNCLRFGAVFRRDDQGEVVDAPRIPNESVWNGGSLSPVE